MRHVVIVTLLFLTTACLKVEKDEVLLEQEFSNLCEAYQAIAKTALEYHLVKKVSDFSTYHKPAMTRSLKQHKLSVKLPDTDDFCAELENQLAPLADNAQKIALYQTALQYFVSSLDPHSYYQTPLDYQKQQDYLSHKKGLGFTLDIQFRDLYLPLKGLMVEQILNESLKDVMSEGDFIERINEHIVSGQTLGTIDKEFQSSDKVDILVNGQTIRLVKQNYKLPLLFSKQIAAQNKNYLYVKIRKFEEGLSREFAAEVEKYDLQSLSGVVLDLRGNPGGRIDECISMLSLITTEDVVVELKGPTEKKDVVNKFRLDRKYVIAAKRKIFEDLALAVLIDPRSASAAEMMALALKPTLAVIVGKDSFGKGTGQQGLKISSKNGLGGELYITMFRYYLNEGESPQLSGVIPEYKIEDRELTAILNEKKNLSNKSLILHEVDYTDSVSNNATKEQTPEKEVLECSSNIHDCDLSKSLSILDFMAENS